MAMRVFCDQKNCQTIIRVMGRESPNHIGSSRIEIAIVGEASTQGYAFDFCPECTEKFVRSINLAVLDDPLQGSKGSS